MVDAFLLTTTVWIFLFVVEVIHAEIQFATPAALSLGKVWYGRKGSSLNIPCVTEETPGDKYMGAMYNWKEKGDEGRGYLGFRRTIYGNGTLTVVDLQTIDTAQLECVVSKIETAETFNFSHSVVVYYLAEFSMINPFVYTVPTCDEVLTVNKLHDLLEFACGEYRNRAAQCPFTARKDCSKKSQVEASESSDGAYRLRIVIEQLPEKTFVIPDCSLKCMKKSIIGHLQQYGDDLLRRLAQREGHSQSNLFKGFVFEKEELLNRRIRTTCYGGYELFQFILCMPCFPGSYIKYSYQFDETQMPKSQCLPCDSGYYQEKFAMDDCLRCPSMGTTPSNATADIHNCTTSRWSIALAYYATGGILAAVVVATCIAMLAVISKQKKREKDAKRRLEEEQRSGVNSQASSRVDVRSTVQQQSSNNASTNVNVNRRFSSGSIKGRDGVSSPAAQQLLLARSSLGAVSEGPTPYEEKEEEEEEDGGSSSDSSTSDSSRRPMLHESSPAVMQTTGPTRLS